VRRNPFRVRRLLVRLALLFAVAQVVAVASVLFALPALRAQPLGTALLALLAIVDLALLALVSTWVIRGSVADPVVRLAADIQRIADGDYHHRVPDSQRPELKEIRESVNRLADRLIADQRLLAQNVESLQETNRELVIVRDQMVHSARLASVGTLAAGIAHEVGNPLGAITAYVDVARNRTQKSGGDTEILDAIRVEAGRIDRIVRGLLDYARAPGDKAEPALARDVLNRVRSLLLSQGKLEGISVQWEVRDDATEMIAEPHRFEQVLVNLILNALDAMEGIGEPRLCLRLSSEEGRLSRRVRRREDDPPGVNYAHRRRRSTEKGGVGRLEGAALVTLIEVSDNGPGIAPEHLDRIFDPFFTTKEPGKGTGLGLSICARLVEGMGGHIEAGTGPEGGARFLIRLPGTIDLQTATVVAPRPTVPEAP